MRRTYAIALLCIIAVSVSVRAHGDHDHDHDHDHADDDESGEDYTKVTYGSAIKLLHKGSGFRLHSHGIKWGSGSGQQSVTGFEGSDDPNSLWQVKSAFTKKAPTRVFTPGTPIKCGEMIRLQHATTKKWLHSHLHVSPLSKRQEISGYGEDDGTGSDSGDNWKIECAQGAVDWMRDAYVSLYHIDTGKRLYTRKQDGFDHNNCRGCPIVGQLEVSCHSVGAQDSNALWSAEDGIYFPLAQNE